MKKREMLLIPGEIVKQIAADRISVEVDRQINLLYSYFIVNTD